MSPDTLSVCFHTAVPLMGQRIRSSAKSLEPYIFRCREERSSSSEGQIRFLVYTLEIASHRADSLGEELTSALIMA